MPRKPPSKAQAARQAQARHGSPERGDGNPSTRYNSRTGRPIRDGAGKKSSNPEYLDTTEVIDDDQQSESGSEDDEGVKKKRPKRKRTPSPPLPDLDPMPLAPEDVPSREPTPPPAMADTHDGQSITLTFHVPPGFTGPFIVKLDRSMFFGRQGPKRQRLTSPGASSTSSSSDGIRAAPPRGPIITSGRHTFGRRRDGGKKCLVDLPGEIRNTIYRLLFVTKDKVDFGRPLNFSRSSALLRTCKQIYKEGRSVLYSENKFLFDRNNHSRAPYWSSQSREIGYQDMRVFLSSIGPTNVSLLRSITISFSDAAPSATPYLSHEERRFIRDEHLIYCLRLLARYSNLKDIMLRVFGRKSVCHTDYRFLDALREIKADTVTFDTHFFLVKIDHDVKVSLLETMQRSPKLYPGDE